MVSNSRNIPSRGGADVSSVVGAVAKISNLRSATSRRVLYMHVHNYIRDGECAATSGWPNDPYGICVLSHVSPQSALTPNPLSQCAEERGGRTAQVSVSGIHHPEFV